MGVWGATFWNRSLPDRWPVARTRGRTQFTQKTVMNSPRPPKHLSEEAKNFWRQVFRDFQLENHHVKLLTAACECLDRASEAREAVARDGPFFKTRYGEIRPHPGLQVERDQKGLLARLLRELNLDSELPSEPYSRPPRLGEK